MEDYYKAYNLLVEVVLESDKKVQCFMLHKYKLGSITTGCSILN